MQRIQSSPFLCIFSIFKYLARVPEEAVGVSLSLELVISGARLPVVHPAVPLSRCLSLCNVALSVLLFIMCNVRMTRVPPFIVLFRGRVQISHFT